ncbi:MAG: hypothetical protein HKN47_02095 [Pirellulaceae bacterium]|nr:hypothetical protein [Pirellulaceae bacterium]
MRAFLCQCGNRIFFHDVRCLQCDATVGRCDSCHQVCSLTQNDDQTFQCGNSACGSKLQRCTNCVNHGVCNGTVAAGDSGFCEYCRLNQVVPNLSQPENKEAWRLLEFAKHRVLFIVQTIGFPLNWQQPPLQFAFLSGTPNNTVTMGHSDGLITIALRETDAVQREKSRIEFDEPQRTLVRHFRHELGHYYWDVLVKPQRLSEFRTIFGDESAVNYEAAKEKYYGKGPAANWRTNWVSQYASMHPWEDFAETFNAYLDMVAVLDTARSFSVADTGGDFDSMIKNYCEIGILANEWNRDRGLIDLVPEIFSPVITNKLRFIFDLAHAQSSPA